MAANPHPGNDYYVGPTGEIQRQANPVLAEGLLLAGWKGPYTWATAKKIASGGNNYQKAASGVTSAVSGITEVGAVAKAAFLALTDAGMWRSLGAIILGLALMFAGLRLWLGKPLLPKPPPVIPVPV
jgi:hypothetical protein